MGDHPSSSISGLGDVRLLSAKSTLAASQSLAAPRVSGRSSTRLASCSGRLPLGLPSWEPAPKVRPAPAAAAAARPGLNGFPARPGLTPLGGGFGPPGGGGGGLLRPIATSSLAVRVGWPVTPGSSLAVRDPASPAGRPSACPAVLGLPGRPSATPPSPVVARRFFAAVAAAAAATATGLGGALWRRPNSGSGLLLGLASPV